MQMLPGMLVAAYICLITSYSLLWYVASIGPPRLDYIILVLDYLGTYRTARYTKKKQEARRSKPSQPSSQANW